MTEIFMNFYLNGLSLKLQNIPRDKPWVILISFWSKENLLTADDILRSKPLVVHYIFRER